MSDTDTPSRERVESDVSRARVTTGGHWQRAVELLGADVCRRLGIYVLPDDFLLSVVIPVYNEIATVAQVIERVRSIDIPTEIIVVDDGSTDGARQLLESYQDSPDLRVIFHQENRGKGAALKTGFLAATGQVVVVQDADLEYDPQDFRFLLQPIIEDRADVVYGSRFSGPDHQFLPAWHYLANQVITTLFSFVKGYRITDVETCYKMFRREVIQSIAPQLRESRFGVELELTARLLKRRDVRFCERPISYDRRGYDAGKKIGVRDGLRALYCIVRY